MNKWKSKEVIVLIIALCLVPKPALAYIDPGLGSIIFQGLIAGFVAVGAAWAAVKARIMAPFWKKRPTEEAVEEDQNDQRSGA